MQIKLFLTYLSAFLQFGEYGHKQPNDAIQSFS